MGEKDLSQKQLLECEDTFSDIANTLLLGGREIIRPEELKPAKRDSLYKDRELRLRMQERDIAKLWQRGQIRLAFLGLEDQTKVCRTMPLRVIGYDGAVYRDQLNRIEPGDGLEGSAGQSPLPLYPAITMVLHFDYEHRWTGPRTLKECFPHIPPELAPYVNDYRIHVFEIAWLPDETVQKFKSDFRFVADYYSQMRKAKKWKPMPGEVKHVKELFDLFGSLTNDTRFVEMYRRRKGEESDMSSIALDYLAAEYIAQGEARGEARGRAEGMESAREEIALAMFEDHFPVEKVAKYSMLTLQAAAALGRKHGYIQS